MTKIKNSGIIHKKEIKMKTKINEYLKKSNDFKNDSRDYRDKALELGFKYFSHFISPFCGLYHYYSQLSTTIFTNILLTVIS